MLFKSLEFKNVVGQKVKVMDIPVLKEDSPYHFLIQVRLQVFTSALYQNEQSGSVYSFRDYLKKKLKWPVYDEVFRVPELKNNA